METFEKLVAEEFQPLSTDKLLHLLKESADNAERAKLQLKYDNLLEQFEALDEECGRLEAQVVELKQINADLRDDYEDETYITYNLRKENEYLNKMYNDYVRDAEATIEELRHRIKVLLDNGF